MAGAELARHRERGGSDERIDLAHQSARCVGSAAAPAGEHCRRALWAPVVIRCASQSMACKPVLSGARSSSSLSA